MSKWLIAAIILFRILFVVTYIPDCSGDDALHYGGAAASGQVNLTLAPGAPWFIGLPLRLALDIDERLLSSLSGRDPKGLGFQSGLYSKLVTLPGVNVFVYLYTGFVTILDLIFIFLLYQFLARHFSRTAGHLAAGIIGLNPYHAGAMYSFSPEGPQGIFLVLMLALLYVYYRYKSSMHLILSAAVLALSYFVKYNSIYFFLSIVFAILLSNTIFIRKLAEFSLAAGTFLILVAAYTLFVFYPQTGSITHQDTGWVLMADLQNWIKTDHIRTEAGPESTRLHILNSVLSWDHPITAYRHVDYLKKDMRAIREENRENFHWLLQATPNALRALLAEYPPRPQPRTLAYSYLPTFANIGPDYSNQICARAWLEHVFAFPGVFIESVASDSINQLFGNLLFNSHSYYAVIKPAMYSPDDSDALGFVGLTGKNNRAFNYYLSESVKIWLPGHSVFGLFYWLAAKISSVIMLIIVPIVIVVILDKNRGNIGVTLIFCVSLYLGFVIFSNFFYVFRTKEMSAVFPLLAISISLASTYVYRKLTGSVKCRI